MAEEVRGNATVSVKDEARGFHLNNLSYAGPIVMGFGGTYTYISIGSRAHVKVLIPHMDSEICKKYKLFHPSE